MRVVYFTQRGSLLPFAMRTKKSGHAVLLVSAGKAGQGLVDIKQVNLLSPLSAHSICKDFSADFAVFDYKGKVADSLRSKGVPVFGASEFGENSNNDTMLLDIAGIPKAIDANGIPIVVTMWFNGNEGVLFYYSLLTHRFMDGELGRDVGCSTCITGLAFPHSKIVKDSVLKLTRILRKASYRAPINIYGIITPSNEFKAYSVNTEFMFEPTCAFGELCKDNLVDIMQACATGASFSGKYRIGEVASAVRVSIPPYPYPTSTLHFSTFIDGCSKDNSSHIWFRDVKMDGDTPENAGGDGWLMCITARGVNPNEAKRRVYRTLQHLSISEAQYRTDVGWHRLKDFEALQKTSLIYTRVEA